VYPGDFSRNRGLDSAAPVASSESIIDGEWSMVTVRFWAAAVICGVVVGLTGCAADDPLSQVRRLLASESSAQDILPVDALPLTSDPESSRLVGTNAGISYFVTKYVDPDSGSPGFCVILAHPPQGAVSGCASDANGTRMRVGGSVAGSARLVTADDPVPHGWAKLGGFLIVNADPLTS